MKKILLTCGLIALLAVYIFYPNPAPCFAQTFISVGGLGVATIDDNVSNYKFGGGYFVAVNEQVGSNLMMGISYGANRIVGKADFSTLNTQSVTGISKLFLKPIDTPSKFNFYLITAGGWIALKNTDGTDDGVNGVFGGGFTYTFYEGVRLTVEPTINAFADDVTAFCINAGLTFPLNFGSK